MNGLLISTFILFVAICVNASQAAAPVRCREDWKRVGRFCFRDYPAVNNYAAALEQCRKVSTQLLDVTQLDDAELNGVYDVLNQFYPNFFYFWIKGVQRHYDAVTPANTVFDASIPVSCSLARFCDGQCDNSAATLTQFYLKTKNNQACIDNNADNGFADPVLCAYELSQ